MPVHALLFFSPSSPSSLSSSPSSLLPLLRHSPSTSLPQTIIHPTRTQPQRITASRVADSSASVFGREAATVAEAEEVEARLVSGSDVVRRFYEGINRHDLVSVEGLIADDCVYEDLVFPRPFVGRKAIMEFFKKFNDSISTDLQFVIDDISDEDNAAVGVTWHLGCYKGYSVAAATISTAGRSLVIHIIPSGMSLYIASSPVKTTKYQVERQKPESGWTTKSDQNHSDAILRYTYKEAH
ncbi:hypothetical protein AKJ16_DCAP14737 [Drosera capensis]